MTFTEALKRAGATFVQAFLALIVVTGISGTASDLSLLWQATIAGATALATYAHRAVQAYLEKP